MPSYKNMQHHRTAHTLHWLPMKQCIDYKLAVLTYKARHSGSPPYLASLISDYVPSCLPRSLHKLLLNRPYTSLIVVDKAFSVSAPKIWNELSFNCHAVAQTVLNVISSMNYFPSCTLITPTNQSLLTPPILFFWLELIGAL